MLIFRFYICTDEAGWRDDKNISDPEVEYFSLGSDQNTCRNMGVRAIYRNALSGLFMTTNKTFCDQNIFIGTIFL